MRHLGVAFRRGRGRGRGGGGGGGSVWAGGSEPETMRVKQTAQMVLPKTFLTLLCSYTKDRKRAETVFVYIYISTNLSRHGRFSFLLTAL